MDPQAMQQFINSVPPTGTPAGSGQPAIPAEPPVFQPNAAPVFPPAAPAAPAAPMFTQPPAPGAPYIPAAPTWPQQGQQQFQPQPPAPVMPGGQVFQQPGQQQGQPIQPQNGIPLVTPQIPGQQGNDVPQWAQGLIDQVQQLQQRGPQQNQSWDENNRPRTWQEMYASIDKMTTDKAAALITEQQQQAQQVQQQQQQQRQVADSNLDAMEGQLQQMGLLAPVGNQYDPNDAGKLARQELYAYALSIGVEDTRQLGPVASTLYALHQNGQYFDKNRNAIVNRPSQQPGAFAPIAGAGPSAGGGAMMGGGQFQGQQQRTGPTTRELATMSVSQIAQMGARAFGLG